MRKEKMKMVHFEVATTAPLKDLRDKALWEELVQGTFNEHVFHIKQITAHVVQPVKK